MRAGKTTQTPDHRHYGDGGHEIPRDVPDGARTQVLNDVGTRGSER